MSIKNKKFKGILLLAVISLAFSIFLVSSSMIESCTYNSGSTYISNPSVISSSSQTFTIGNSSNNGFYILNKISLYASGSDCNITVYIRDANNEINLVSNSTFQNVSGWFNVSMPNIYLYPSTTYRIIIQPLSCILNFPIYCNYDGGDFYQYFDSGWKGNYFGDVMFQVWADELLQSSSPKVTLISPADNYNTKSNLGIFTSSFQNLFPNVNYTFYIWNETNLLNNYSKSTSNYYSSGSNFFILSNKGLYKWNLRLCDNTSNCTFASNNFTLNYTSYSDGCIPKTCEQIEKTCGNWSNGCNGTINCGTCPDQYITKNHVNVLGCSNNCIGFNGMTSCDNLTTNNHYSYYMPLLQSSYDFSINYFGGYNYLNSLDYYFPDINVTFQCGEGYQYTGSDGIFVNYWDLSGTSHEVLHWLLRHYSEPTNDFYWNFEEGFTQYTGFCRFYSSYGSMPTCCDNNMGNCTLTLDQVCTPDKIGQYPVCSNYQVMQFHMLEMFSSYYNCDMEHCWKWFFKNIVAKKNGDNLDIIDIYSFLVNYVGNKTKVDNLLNIYLPYTGNPINVSNLDSYIYTIPSEAYPNGQALYCGDGLCSYSEDCSICSSDCGICQIDQDTTYPIFSNYKDDSYKFNNSGIGNFNVTVDNTNGTVILFINGSNYLASNISNEYNVSLNLTTGNYSYYWISFGNGSENNQNSTHYFDYIVNSSIINEDNIYPIFTNTRSNSPIHIGEIIYINSTILNTNGEVAINFGGSLPQSGVVYYLTDIGNNTYSFNTTLLKEGLYYYQYRALGNGSNNNYGEDNDYYIEVINNTYIKLINNIVSDYGGILEKQNSTNWIILTNRQFIDTHFNLYNLSNTLISLSNGTGFIHSGTYSFNLPSNYYIKLIDNYLLNESETDVYNNSEIAITGIIVNLTNRIYHIKNDFNNTINISASFNINCNNINSIRYTPKGESSINIINNCSNSILHINSIKLNPSNDSNELDIEYFMGITNLNTNNTKSSNTSIVFNYNISDNSLQNISWNWNNSNYSLFDDQLVLFYNFDNRSSLGENDTYIVDLSNYSNNGTISGGINISWNPIGKYNGAFNYSGNVNYITIPNSLTLNGTTGIKQLSVSFWLKMFNNPSTTRIISKSDVLGGTSAQGWEFWADGTTINFGLNNQTGSTFLKSRGYSYNLNEWIYVTGVYNNTDLLLYRNGILNQTTSVNFTNIIVNNSIKIGIRNSALSQGLNGSIDELMIWNRSLNQDEILKLYNLRLTKYDNQSWSISINQSINRTLLNSSSPSLSYDYELCISNQSSYLICSDKYTITQNILNTLLVSDFTNILGISRNDFYGVNTHGKYLSNNLTQIDTNNDGVRESTSNQSWHREQWINSKMNLIRIDMSLNGWTNNSDGSFSPASYLERNKETVKYAYDNNFKVILIGGYMPDWLANKTDSCKTDNTTCGTNNLTRYGDLLISALNYYTNNGLWIDTISVESWNEPFDHFLLSAESTNYPYNRSRIFFQIHNETYNRIKAIYPNVKIGANIGHFGYGTSDINITQYHYDWFFSNLTNKSDFIGIHLYRDLDISNRFNQEFNYLSQNISNYGIKQQEFYITEWNIYNETTKNLSNGLFNYQLAEFYINLLINYPYNISSVFYEWSNDYKFGTYNSNPWMMLSEPQLNNRFYSSYNITKNFASTCQSGSILYNSSGDSYLKTICCKKGYSNSCILVNTDIDSRNITTDGLMSKNLLTGNTVNSYLGLLDSYNIMYIGSGIYGNLNNLFWDKDSSKLTESKSNYVEFTNTYSGNQQVRLYNITHLGISCGTIKEGNNISDSQTNITIQSGDKICLQ